MHTTALGRSATTVSELSLGAAALGNLFHAISDEDAAATVEAAWSCGIRSFDTAPHYGLGLSERRLGAALRTRPRSQYTLSTKVGRLLRPLAQPQGDDLANGFAVPAAHERVWDFSARGVRTSIEDSLTRLGLDRVDIVYLHDPDEHERDAFDHAYPELERMRAEGTVGAIGAGMNQTVMLTRFVRDTDVDVVLLAGRYSLLDQSGLSALLPEAARRGVSVLVGGVFNSGLLADPRPGATFEYAPAPQPVLDRALALKALCEEYDVPLRAAALQFPLGHPAVAGVLLGARSAAEVADAAAMFEHPVPADLWSALRSRGLLPTDVPLPVPHHDEGRP
ncbi:aldo/keto reductase [Kitasatospora paracochleata]|uniref:D-threo-aldose 1-dehydrogenase n=1 Tax=Kitasatospora paracochleata TaxID=58354 RepID=A0ABT1IW80_9ACTN|nr:aldo/keto reductase [Kitasatospora paracochleata]MCP2309400.1 D-threo-aldose 1-dehydrogenase [Kitasatospora paracochleata]